jgi:hypothetical protein
MSEEVCAFVRIELPQGIGSGSLERIEGSPNDVARIADVPGFTIKSGRTNARPDIPKAEWHKLTRFVPVYVDRANQ